MKKILILMLMLVCVFAVSSCGDDETCKHTTTTIIEAVASTCTEDGSTSGMKCASCGFVIMEPAVKAAEGHKEVILNGVDATCLTNGVTEGKKCTVCSEVTAIQKTIAAIGHVDEDGNNVCDVCNSTVNGCDEHQLVAIPAVNPTCTDDGMSEGKKCSVCGVVVDAPVKVHAIGHKEVILPAVAATCEETGKTEGKQCSVCEEITVMQITVPKAHKPITMKGTKPTCTETGISDWEKCSVCGDTVTAWTVLPPHPEYDGDYRCDVCNAWVVNDANAAIVYINSMFESALPNKIVTKISQKFGERSLDAEHTLITGNIGADAATVYTWWREELRSIEEGSGEEVVSPEIKVEGSKEFLTSKGTRVNGGTWSMAGSNKVDFAPRKGDIGFEINVDNILFPKYANNTLSFKVNPDKAKSVLGTAIGVDGFDFGKDTQVKGNISVDITYSGGTVTGIVISYIQRGLTVEEDVGADSYEVLYPDVSVKIEIEYDYNIQSVTLTKK